MKLKDIEKLIGQKVAYSTRKDEIHYPYSYCWVIDVGWQEKPYTRSFDFEKKGNQVAVARELMYSKEKEWSPDVLRPQDILGPYDEMERQRIAKLEEKTQNMKKQMAAADEKTKEQNDLCRRLESQENLKEFKDFRTNYQHPGHILLTHETIKRLLDTVKIARELGLTKEIDNNS